MFSMRFLVLLIVVTLFLSVAVDAKRYHAKRPVRMNKHHVLAKHGVNAAAKVGVLNKGVGNGLARKGVEAAGVGNGLARKGAKVAGAFNDGEDDAVLVGKQHAVNAAGMVMNKVENHEVLAKHQVKANAAGL